MDGNRTLPDQNARAGEYGDESACAGLQPNVRHEDFGHRPNDAGDEGLWSLLCFRNGIDLRGIASDSGSRFRAAYPAEVKTVGKTTGPNDL